MDSTLIGTEYQQLLQIIEAYYGSGSAQYEEILRYGVSAENFASIAKQAGYDVVVNQKGQILSYSKNVLAQNVSSGSNSVTEIVGSLNSNLQTGTAANTTALQTIANTNIVEEAGVQVVKESPLVKYTNGVKGVLNKPVAGKVLPAIIAASAGIQLGKAIDGTIYNIGTAMGLNPPESLNPDTWGSITADMSDTGWEGVAKWAFNTIFGIDDNGNSSMYVDEQALAYMAQWLNSQGIMSSEGGTLTDITVDGEHIWKNVEVTTSTATLMPHSSTEMWAGAHTGYYKTIYGKTREIIKTAPSGTKIYMTLSTSGKLLMAAEYWDDGNLGYIDDDGYLKIYAGSTGLSVGVYGKSARYQYETVNTTGTATEYGSLAKTAWAMVYGNTVGGTVEGVSNLEGANVPDVSSITTVPGMLEKLKELYPELWENRVEHDVVQPDGTIKNIIYVPIAMPTGGEGTAPTTTGATQGETVINPSVDPDGLIDTVIKIITNNSPQGVTNPESPPTTPTVPTNPNPPDTGTGSTPPTIIPTGSASSLYAIYNPTLEEINSLGAWLWSSDFIDQLLKLFSDPMQAIIGLHKIYAQPTISGRQNIKVGYLDSGVNSNVVSEQYTSVDCGTIALREYFGNVFDYDPFTKIQLYLPFIGIVPLNTGDVMRSTIQVMYHVDVLSGACLAEVRVIRDGGGGTLYQYSGNASVQMPISSGSYMGIVSGVLSIAGGIAGTIATGGAAMPMLMGAAGSAMNMHTNVQHSGSFSGNSGAMGIKKPYLIITRPQTALANGYENFIGNPANQQTILGSCTGWVACTEIHLEGINATANEMSEIESLLKEGVII